MATKFWDWPGSLADSFHHRTREGHRNIVIQYEAYIDGEWRAIVRFDEAHGFFHRDIMSPSGEQEKQPQPAIDKNLALNEAINHIKNFWQTYRNAYEVEYNEQK